MARLQLFLIGLLLSGCAQIASLTGGEQDETAAKTVIGSQHPAQGEVNFNGKELEVSFDEYFTINDAQNTVSMNPQAGKISVTNEKKKVKISWSEFLQPNTTYIIQLDGTIRDINEKNDTIHQFVFSTGPVLDTLQIKGKITDAETGKYLENYTVGLYAIDSFPLTGKYSYATRTNKQGEFVFTNLKDASYQLFAFLDNNKDRIYTIDEPYAFIAEPVQTVDTTFHELRAFKPKNSLNKLKVQLDLPGTAIVTGRVFNPDSLFVNQYKAFVLNRFADDSLKIALPEFTSSFTTFVYQNDTVTKPITATERAKKFPVRCTNYKNTLLPEDSVHFIVNEFVSTVDKSRILVLDENKDTLSFQTEFHNNQITLFPEQLTTKKFNVNLKSGAILGNANQNDSIRFNFEQKAATDLCNLTIKCADLTGENWKIQLMDGKILVAELPKAVGDTAVTFQNILPASYQLVCYQDENGNGSWDLGNFNSKKQAELIYRFVIQSKLRPNWDIIETIALKPHE